MSMSPEQLQLLVEAGFAEKLHIRKEDDDMELWKFAVEIFKVLENSVFDIQPIEGSKNDFEIYVRTENKDEFLSKLDLKNNSRFPKVTVLDQD